MKKKMIKNLMFVVVMVVLCLAVGMTASAETWGDYEYRVLEDGTVEIADYIGFATEIEIPNEIDGKDVTSIGGYAFSNCDSLTSIILPDSVEAIEDEAVMDCLKLAYVYIGSGVKNIGENNFLYCSNLLEIIVDESNESFSSDECGVLFNKEKTILIRYPEGNKATTYDIPYGVTTISVDAFAENCYLTSVKIPDTVTRIDFGAFYQCISLSSIEIPESVRSIGYGCFLNTPFLKKIVINNMDVELSEMSFGATQVIISGISQEEFIEIYKGYLLTGDESVFAELEEYYTFVDIAYIGTIYCHAGSTAEKYAIENDVDYVLTHFYEGEWTYDYDNMIRYRKCIHCDELETESLETTESGDVEIIEPTNPDTDFTVDVIEDYVVIEETISNNITTDFEIVKAFDINLKNKDGVHVQPDGTVKVKLPLDWSKDGNYKVYRVNDDGTLTDMNAYREGSHMVFDTDHFSIYVIVDESEKTDEPIAPDEPQEETKDSFFLKIIDLIKAFFELIMSWFKK